MKESSRAAAQRRRNLQLKVAYKLTIEVVRGDYSMELFGGILLVVAGIVATFFNR
jgi:hypothetical protein